MSLKRNPSHDDLHHISNAGIDIQVFTRREARDDESALFSASAASAASLAADVPLLEDDVSEMCVSFVEDVFEPPRTTLAGRIVFGVTTVCCVVALSAMALIHIWAHGQATRMGFVYSQSSKKASRLKEQRRVLGLQLAKLRNPKRLARIARQQLGMRLPPRSQVIGQEQVAARLRRARMKAPKQVQLAIRGRNVHIR